MTNTTLYIHNAGCRYLLPDFGQQTWPTLLYTCTTNNVGRYHQVNGQRIWPTLLDIFTTCDVVSYCVVIAQRTCPRIVRISTTSGLGRYHKVKGPRTGPRQRYKVRKWDIGSYLIFYEFQLYTAHWIWLQ